MQVIDLQRAVFDLLKIMTEGSDKNKWNRATFTVTPDGKFNMEFNWDQELDNKIRNA